MRKLIYFLWITFCFCGCFVKSGFAEEVLDEETDLATATEVKFNDENFYACVLESLDKEENAIVTDEELEKITALTCNKRGIKDVTELKKMIALQTLDLSSNELTEIDISNNVELTSLNVSNNELSSLDVSKNLLLEYIDIEKNQIPRMNLSKNTNLVYLAINGNKINDIDLSKQENLTYLKIDYDLVNKVALTALESLEELYLYDSYVVPVYNDVNDNMAYSFFVKDIKKYFPSNIMMDDYVVFGSEDDGFSLGEDTHFNLNSTITTRSDHYYLYVLGEDLVGSNIKFDGKQSFGADYELRFVTLDSKQYVIDEEKAVIDVGTDSDEVIKASLKTNFDDVVILIEGDKLSLSYQDKVVREFSLERVSNPMTGSLTMVVASIIMIISIVSIMTVRKSIYSDKI